MSAVLYDISSDGQVVRQAVVKMPARLVHPTEMSLTRRSELFVTFSGSTVDKRGGVHTDTIYATVRPATGEITATYRLPPSTSLMPAACAISPNDFEFVGSTKHDKLEIVKFSAN